MKSFNLGSVSIMEGLKRYHINIKIKENIKV